MAKFLACSELPLSAHYTFEVAVDLIEYCNLRSQAVSYILLSKYRLKIHPLLLDFRPIMEDGDQILQLCLAPRQSFRLMCAERIAFHGLTPNQGVFEALECGI